MHMSYDDGRILALRTVEKGVRNLARLSMEIVGDLAEKWIKGVGSLNFMLHVPFMSANKNIIPSFTLVFFFLFQFMSEGN